VFDLTRSSLAGFQFPVAAALEQSGDFRAQCQERCRFHADEVSALIRRGLDHKRTAFDDPFCVDAAFESAKIQIIHTATVANDLSTVEMMKRNVNTNLELLQLLHLGKEGQSPYVSRRYLGFYLLPHADFPADPPHPLTLRRVWLPRCCRKVAARHAAVGAQSPSERLDRAP
jgi:hypothetical protein